MIRKFSLGLASVVLVAAPTAAMAASFGFNLRLTVAVQCSVQHQATGFGLVRGDTVSLGTFRAYCKAPAGYDMVINYETVSLVGERHVQGRDTLLTNASVTAELERTRAG